MKFTINNIVILILLLLTGCRKFEYYNKLDLQHIDSATLLQDAVNGVYADFARIFTNYEDCNSYIFPCVFSDDINPNFIDQLNCVDCNGNSLVSIYNRTSGFQTSDQYGNTIRLDYGCTLIYGYPVSIGTDWKVYFFETIDDFYKSSYKAIASENNILEQFPDITMQDSVKTRLIGETYYMRAYTYFRLTRIFGNIPLILNTEVNYKASRASFGEIYAQIVSDLKNAVTLLPAYTSKDHPSTICPNRGSAEALLAEVYLTMGGFPLHKAGSYALAEKYARNVIDSTSVFGFGLLDDFARLYAEDYETNKEMISGVIYKTELSSVQLQELDQIRPTFTSNQLDDGIFPVYAKTRFLNNCPMNYRKEVTYDLTQTTNYFDTTNSDRTKWAQVDCTFVPRKTTTCYRIPLIKTTTRDYTAYRKNQESYKVYILRFAHTLLTYAEASARAGDLNPESYEAVNEVRRRAYKLPVNVPSKYDLKQGLSPQQFADSVVWERAWEFTGEAECRWFDLLRLDMTDSLDELLDPYDAKTPDGILQDNRFFPIPREDILLDPNLATY